MTEPAAPAGDHLDGFVRSLGDAGVRVTPPKRIDFLRALALLPPASVDALYWTARVTLVAQLEDLAPFDRVFDAWFRGGPLPRLEVRLPEGGEEGQIRTPRPSGEGDLRAAALGDRTGVEPSFVEVVGRKTFPAPEARTRALLADLRRALPAALPTVAARRLRRARSGRRLDLPRSCREATRTTGEVVRLSWRRRPRRARPVLVLVDVSGSMKQYSADLLRLAHAVVASAPRAEAFAIGTRLTRVTEELRCPEPEQALEALGRVVLDADAGTRLGEALDALLATARTRSRARGALVLVLSDGLERGDCEAMIRCVRRLDLLAHRLVWWSPLACSPGYRPVTRGLAGALDSVDELAGVRDLDTALAAVRRLPATLARPRGGATRAWLRDLEEGAR